MRRLQLSLIVIHLLLYNGLLFSQQTETDSLLQKIDEVDGKEKVVIYNRLARIYYYEDPKITIDYGKNALSIAKQEGLKEERFFALLHIGIGYSILGDNNEAVGYHKQALDLAVLFSDKILQSIANNELGVDYRFIGDYDKSLNHFLKVLELEDEIPADKAGEQKRKKSIAGTMSNIGVIYNDLGNYDKAIEYFESALKIRREIKDKRAIAASLNNIGVAFQKKGELENALNYHYQSLSIKIELGHKRDIAKSNNNIGIILQEKGEFKKALGEHFKALDIYKQIGDKIGTSLTLNRIGEIYLEQNRPNSAFPYLNESLLLSEEIRANEQIRESYMLLAEYYKAVGDFQNAYKTQKKLIVLKDTLFSEEMTEKVAEMQTKYETEKKEKEIEILARDKEIQSLEIKKQSVQLYLLVGFTVFVLVIVFLVFNRIKLKQKNVRTVLEKKNLETEQRLLRSQMNPHFIFNSMNSIQSYISGNDSFTAMTYLSKFAQLMRNILDNSRKPLIALSDEINTLELYMELERSRFNKKFDFKITIDPELPVDVVYIPPMLIQPFIENSIKHGLRNKESKGLLEIEFMQNHKLISCIVKDNGIGREKAESMKKENGKSHRSLGMQVTQERLSALSKAKSVDVNFEITDLKNNNDEAEGTQVLIRLPFEIE